MRWPARTKNRWRPGFAFFPVRDTDTNRMIWLEPIWVQHMGDYIAWLPWEDRPNDQPSPPNTEG